MPRPADAPWAAAVALVMALVPAAPAHAVHSLLTEDTATQGEGGYQADLLLTLGEDRTAAGHHRARLVQAALARGLGEDLDVVLSGAYLWLHDEDVDGTVEHRGAGDTGLDLKWRFHEAGRLSMALKPGVRYATGDAAEGLGAGRTVYLLSHITSVETEAWATNLHLSYIRNRNRVDETRDLWHASAGAWYRPSSRLRLVGDIGSYRLAEATGEANPAFLTVGLVYNPVPEVDIDVGRRYPLRDTETDRQWLLGVSRRF
jgi:hypothetical protein